jgi:hypothetical protein
MKLIVLTRSRLLSLIRETHAHNSIRDRQIPANCLQLHGEVPDAACLSGSGGLSLLFLKERQAFVEQLVRNPKIRLLQPVENIFQVE